MFSTAILKLLSSSSSRNLVLIIFSSSIISTLKKEDFVKHNISNGEMNLVDQFEACQTGSKNKMGDSSKKVIVSLLYD